MLVSTLKAMCRYFKALSDSSSKLVVYTIFKSLYETIHQDSIEQAYEKIKEKIPTLRKYKVKIKGPNATKLPSWKEILLDLSLILSLTRSLTLDTAPSELSTL